MEISSNYIVLKLIRVVLVILTGFVSIFLFGRVTNIVLARVMRKNPLYSYRARLSTLRSIISSLLGFIVFLIIILVIISDLGFNITPFLTGAGILGLLLSFGAQTLIKDIIAGFFLMIDNQINIGDKVKIDDQEGVVIKILIRSTILRDKHGNLVIIPNSEIRKIVIIRHPAIRSI